MGGSLLLYQHYIGIMINYTCQFAHWRVSETRQMQTWESKSDLFLKVTSNSHSLTPARLPPRGTAAGHQDNARYHCYHWFASLISREFPRKPLSEL